LQNIENLQFDTVLVDQFEYYNKNEIDRNNFIKNINLQNKVFLNPFIDKKHYDLSYNQPFEQKDFDIILQNIYSSKNGLYFIC
jgi:hypothetical protein